MVLRLKDGTTEKLEYRSFRESLNERKHCYKPMVIFIQKQSMIFFNQNTYICNRKYIVSYGANHKISRFHGIKEYYF